MNTSCNYSEIKMRRPCAEALEQDIAYAISQVTAEDAQAWFRLATPTLR